MKFTISEDPSLALSTIYLVCLIHASDWKIRFLLKFIILTNHLSLNYFPSGKEAGEGGGEAMNFRSTLSPNPTNITYQIW